MKSQIFRVNKFETSSFRRRTESVGQQPDFSYGTNDHHVNGRLNDFFSPPILKFITFHILILFIHSRSFITEKLVDKKNNIVWCHHRCHMADK